MAYFSEYQKQTHTIASLNSATSNRLIISNTNTPIHTHNKYAHPLLNDLVCGLSRNL